MDIIEDKQDTIHVFKLNGRLDSNTSIAFEEKLFAAIDKESTHVAIDCADLDYVSSAGLRIFLKATKILKPLNGSIVLCGVRDYVREVLEISGFDTFLPILPGIDDALKAT